MNSPSSEQLSSEPCGSAAHADAERQDQALVDKKSHWPDQPSALYRAELWRIGVFMARRLPHFVLGKTARNLAKLYWLSCPRRRRVVFENLLPAVKGDRLAARLATRELFQQFALKLADLW